MRSSDEQDIPEEFREPEPADGIEDAVPDGDALNCL